MDRNTIKENSMKKICKMMVFISMVCLTSAVLVGQDLVEYSIGDTGPAGGIVFFDKGSYSDGWRYLEAAPTDQAESVWGGMGIVTGSGYYDVGLGKENTVRITSILNTEELYAAGICAELVLGGYDDWFLPSKVELALLYTNLFERDLGGLAPTIYWSSSEDDENYAYVHVFGQDLVTSIEKSFDGGRVRAIRAF